VRGDVAVALVVSEEEDDVRALAGEGGVGLAAKNAQECEEEEADE
jgi:hypothetical protein